MFFIKNILYKTLKAYALELIKILQMDLLLAEFKKY